MAQSAPTPVLQENLSPVMVTDQSTGESLSEMNPASGGRILGIGQTGPLHSYLQPSLRAAETLDSNPLMLSSSDNSYRGFTLLGGSLIWAQNLGRESEFQYSGAVRYDTKAELQGYSQFSNSHAAAFSKIMRFRRIRLLIDDEAQYSQGSNFGAAGMEGLGLLGNQASQLNSWATLQLSSSSLRPDILPGQSILTGDIGRITNTAMVEMDSQLSGRSTVTMAASYGLLHFESSQLVNTQQAAFIAGYNRSLTKNNSLAMEGSFARFTFQGSGNTIDTEYFTALYARQLSGRTSFEIGIGPQVTQLNAGGESTQYVGWQGRATLQHRMRNANLSGQAARGISNGAGVLGGSVTTSGSASLGVRVSQNYNFSMTYGISRSELLGASQAYKTQFAGATINRAVGRYASLYLSYDSQYQATQSTCTGPACTYTGLRNVFGLGLAWTPRPIGVD
jgi:hypothetical protein